MEASFYVIVSNIAKKQNIGLMMRSACAFGVKEIIVAGSAKNTQTFGAQGTDKHVHLVYFPKIDGAVAYAKEKGCKIIGVEIKPEAVSIVNTPFKNQRNVAFMLGNEGLGMTDKQCELCDSFVYIPHYGDGTASLNVSVAASIVFQSFASQASYPERKRSGEKFIVKAIPEKRGPESELDFIKIQERKAKKQVKLLEN